MPMGIVSDSELESELGKLSDTVKPNSIIKEIEKGRGNGNRAVPESLRKVIGDSALVEKNEEVARAFDVSESAVSAYKVGATSTSSYHNPDRELKSHTDQARERISARARRKLLLALNGITKDKLEGIKAKDLAGIAKDMSAVIKNIEPQVENQVNQNAQFVFFAPKQKESEDYAVINVRE